MTTFGIDLGTANSCIAYIGESGRPVIINNTSGEPTVVPKSVKTSQKAEDMLHFDLDNELETIRTPGKRDSRRSCSGE